MVEPPFTSSGRKTLQVTDVPSIARRSSTSSQRSDNDSDGDGLDDDKAWFWKAGEDGAKRSSVRGSVRGSVRLSIRGGADSLEEAGITHLASQKIDNAKVESIAQERRKSRMSVNILPDERSNMLRRAVVGEQKDENTCQMVKVGITRNCFCKRLEDGQLQRIIDQMQLYGFKAGEIVCKQGDMGYYFMMVHQGKLEVHINDNAVNTLTTGDAFGAVALLHNCPRTATIKTLTDATLWAVDRQTFQSVLVEYSEKRAAENRKFLDSISIFDGLSSRLKARIGELAIYEESFSKGARVVTDGDANPAIFIVKRGQLRVLQDEGTEIANLSRSATKENSRVGILTTGDSFGTASVRLGGNSTETKRTSVVVADEDVDLVCISVSQLKEVLGNNLIDILEQSATLSVVKQLRSFSHLSLAQHRAVMQRMRMKRFLPFESIEDGLQIIIVLDGEAVGKRNDESLAITRGEFCEMEVQHGSVNKQLLERRRKRFTTTNTCANLKVPADEGPGSEGVRRMNRVLSDRRPIKHLATSAALEENEKDKEGLHSWRGGKKGCRLATLTYNGFIQAMEELGLLQIGHGSNDDEVKERMKRVLMANKIQLFRNLSSEHINSLVESLALKCYRKGATVCVQGEHGHTAFIVASGEVEIMVNDKVVRTTGQGSFLGERALLFDEPRSATIEVASKTAELWSIDRDHFKQLLSPSMQEELVHRAQLRDTNFTLKSLRHVKLIGKGAFGSVRLVQHESTGKRYALKRVRKADADLQDVEREIVLLGDVDHPFSVIMVKTFDTEHSIYMLTELITGGQLWGALEQLGPLQRKDAQFYIGSLSLVLEALHERNIIFRDVKPENVMLDAQGYVKLVDFGIAKKLDEDESRTYTIIGTLFYMAPELLQGLGYGLDVDIWSLGVVFYELVCGAIPFGNGALNQHEVISSIINKEVEFPPFYADSAGKKLLQGMLSKRPEKRVGTGMNGWGDILGHRFFKLETPPHFFAKLLGRELEPPFVPSTEKYSRPEDIHTTLSDEDELSNPILVPDEEDVETVAARKSSAAGEFSGTPSTSAASNREAGPSEVVGETGGVGSAMNSATCEFKVTPPSEPHPQNGIRRPSQARNSEAGKAPTKLRDEVTYVRNETPDAEEAAG